MSARVLSIIIRISYSSAFLSKHDLLLLTFAQDLCNCLPLNTHVAYGTEMPHDQHVYIPCSLFDIYSINQNLLRKHQSIAACYCYWSRSFSCSVELDDSNQLSFHLMHNFFYLRFCSGPFIDSTVYASNRTLI